MTVTPNEGPGPRREAMIFYATGRTAAGFRAYADKFVTVDDETGQIIDDAVAVRDLLYALADGIDQLAAEGLTPRECYEQAGLEGILGVPYWELPA